MDSMEQRMRAAFELHELAVAMRREALTREYPEEDAVRIEARLRAWLLHTDPPRPRLYRDSEPAR